MAEHPGSGEIGGEVWLLLPQETLFHFGETVKKEFEEGLAMGRAELSGKPVLASPYRVGTPEYDSWIAGWCQSRSEASKRPAKKPKADDEPFL